MLTRYHRLRGKCEGRHFVFFVSANGKILYQPGKANVTGMDQLYFGDNLQMLREHIGG